MELPPLYSESRCALVEIHRYIHNSGKENRTVDPKILLEIVTRYAKNDKDFENNPKQALLQAIADVTTSHLLSLIHISEPTRH
eukprot:12312890-Karenia_brevis.AAC.1